MKANEYTGDPHPHQQIWNEVYPHLQATQWQFKFLAKDDKWSAKKETNTKKAAKKTAEAKIDERMRARKTPLHKDQQHEHIVGDTLCGKHYLNTENKWV